MPDKRERRLCTSAIGSGTGQRDYRIPNPRLRKDNGRRHTSQLKCRLSSSAAENVCWEARDAAASEMSKHLQYQIDQMSAFGVNIDKNDTSSNVPSPKKIKCVPVLDNKLEQCQTPAQNGQSTPSRHHQATSPLDKVLPPLPQQHKSSECVPVIIDTLHKPDYYSKPEARASTPQKRPPRQLVYASPLQTDLSSSISSTPPSTTTSPSPITRPWAVSPEACSSADNLRFHHDFNSPRSPPLPPVSLKVHRPSTAPYSKVAIKDNSSRPMLCERCHGRIYNGGCNPLDELVTRIVGLLCSCMVFKRSKRGLDRRNAKNDSTNSLEADRVKMSGDIPYGESGWWDE